MVEVPLKGNRPVNHQVIQGRTVKPNFVTQSQGKVQIQIGAVTAAGQGQGDVDSRIVNLHEAADFRPPVARFDTEIPGQGPFVIRAIQVKAGKVGSQGIRIQAAAAPGGLAVEADTAGVLLPFFVHSPAAAEDG